MFLNSPLAAADEGWNRITRDSRQNKKVLVVLKGSLLFMASLCD
jgi:hypoxanthine-guanine phosphoribosyltransferase